jgi:hypothetical protein
MLEELFDKKADIEKMAGRAVTDDTLVAGLVDGLTEKNEDYRYNCSKVLYAVSREHGEIIYPYWDKIAGLLDSKNSFHRMSAVHHLANLTPVDKDNKFEAVFEKYFRLLDDTSVFVAIYIGQASGKIAVAKPGLQKEITGKLLAVDKTHHLPGRKELIKAGIIESFDKYIKDYPEKPEMIEFVKKQIESESPKTRNTAKAFIKKWAK